MKILLAQGNPGTQYAGTRHNIGWTLLDAIAKEYDVAFRPQPKFFAETAETTIEGEKVIFVKPTTYYNETGRTARALVDFYKLDPTHDVLVLHDDLALPFGVVRVRQKGSDAGNNGIKSLNSHLGEQYHRLRIGIHDEHHQRADDVNFVLGKLDASAQKTLHDTILPLVMALLTDFVSGTLETTSHTLV